MRSGESHAESVGDANGSMSAGSSATASKPDIDEQAVVFVRHRLWGQPRSSHPRPLTSASDGSTFDSLVPCQINDVLSQRFCALHAVSG